MEAWEGEATSTGAGDGGLRHAGAGDWSLGASDGGWRKRHMRAGLEAVNGMLDMEADDGFG